MLFGHVILAFETSSGRKLLPRRAGLRAFSGRIRTVGYWHLLEGGAKGKYQEHNYEMLGDMSCELQTNSGVEVALMLQTAVTSARSSWRKRGLCGGARAPPSDCALHQPAGGTKGWLRRREEEWISFKTLSVCEHFKTQLQMFLLILLTMVVVFFTPSRWELCEGPGHCGYGFRVILFGLCFFFFSPR